MMVRLLKPWKFRKVGTILNSVPDGVATMLLRQGKAEEVKEQAKEPKRSFRRAVTSA